MAKVFRDVKCSEDCPEYAEFGEPDRNSYAYCESHRQWWEGYPLGDVSATWKMRDACEVPDHILDKTPSFFG